MKDDQIARFRSFNRFYTAVIGLLDQHYLNSGFSLSEGRILYEIYHATGGGKTGGGKAGGDIARGDIARGGKARGDIARGDIARGGKARGIKIGGDIGKGITARELSVKLNLDKSYLSRMLDQFEKKKLVEKKMSDEDKRSFYLFLSRSGKLAFEKLNVASQQQAIQLLLPLKNAEVGKLIDHMESIRQILTNANMQQNE